MSYSQLNKLRSGKKNGTQVTLNLSSDLAEDSKNEASILHRLKLTYIRISGLCKVFANGSLGNAKFSKTQLSNMVQLGGFGPFSFFMLVVIRSEVLKKQGNIKSRQITVRK